MFVFTQIFVGILPAGFNCDHCSQAIFALLKKYASALICA
jgi:hypothetical protein